MDGLNRLSAAIDELASEPTIELPAADLPNRLLALHRAAARLHAELLRTTAAFEAGAAWQADGAVTPAAWLRHEARVTEGAARDQLRTARLLRDDLPLTAAALAAGEIGSDHVRVIARAATANPNRRASLAEAEPLLIDAARRLGPRMFATVVRRWADAVDPAAAVADEQRAHELRRLSISPTLHGMVAIDGLLDPESGATLMAAVQALAAPGASEDGRTSAQRRADALVELARMALDTGAMPQVAGDRPHLLVAVDYRALSDGHGGAQLLGAVRDLPLGATATQRLACDAMLTPLLMRSGDPIDVGRSTRVVPQRLRRFLAARDGGCRFPGCDRPVAWCDAHHVVPWAHGGATDRSNLVLLCRRHHRAVHEGGFRLELDGAAVSVSRPDGSTLGYPRASAPRAPALV